MARFYGVVGYGTTSETAPSVWTDTITERAYYGDIVNETRFLQPSENVNDDLRLSERISIVADASLLDNYLNIKYVVKAGVYWTVTSVEVQRPPDPHARRCV
jgi:hypothetical protein